MRDIVGIVDMDGFTIRRKFCCKEIAILIMEEDPMMWNNTFHSQAVIDSMSRNDWKTHDYVVNHRIYDVPIYHRDFQSVRMECLDEVVLELYPDWGTMAYKGGHYEKDLLEKLGIPSFNLEELGCPKANQLAPRYDGCPQCGLHQFGHCPKQEVALFARWFCGEMRRRGVTRYPLLKRRSHPFTCLRPEIFCNRFYEAIKL